MTDYTTIKGCRICGNRDLDQIFDMGPMALANAIREVDTFNTRYPLTLLFCPKCSLVQIRETVDPNVLFNSGYVYYSSQSKTMVESARELAERLTEGRKHRLVMEAASNDGYLLQYYLKLGHPVVGVDPAVDCAHVAAEKGVRTDLEFFGSEYAKRYAGQVAIFHANNVLAHTSDQNDFVEGIKTVLAPDGIAVIEFPYLGKMIENREFDTIYHEHLCYFSLSAFSTLVQLHDLVVYDVEKLPIHGGSLRVYVRHPVSPIPEDPTLAHKIFCDERNSGMHFRSYYADFGERVNRLGVDLWRTFDDVHRSYPGASIAGYGAAAKGNQLLTYFGMGPEVIEKVYDSTPAKQGKFMAGVSVPIVAPDPELRDMDYVLILAWNFKDEIMAKHPQFNNPRTGGKWIVPIPNVEILNKEMWR